MRGDAKNIEYVLFSEWKRIAHYGGSGWLAVMEKWDWMELVELEYCRDVE
jgi:hypothetical protein